MEWKWVQLAVGLSHIPPSVMPGEACMYIHNIYVPAGHPGMCRLCVMMKIQFSL